METITKEKIANLLKERLGFSSLICEEITNSIFSEILYLSLTNKKLVLPNFGKFHKSYNFSLEKTQIIRIISSDLNYICEIRGKNGYSK